MKTEQKKKEGQHMKQAVNFKRLDERAVVPTYGSRFSAGADLYAILDEPLVLEPHKTALVHTGIAVEIPEGLVGLVYARSGLACKRGVAPANKVGVIDCDYRGEIMVALYNHTDSIQIIEPCERIAQLVLTPYVTADFIECDELTDTERGEGGFGSTGRK